MRTPIHGLTALHTTLAAVLVASAAQSQEAAPQPFSSPPAEVADTTDGPPTVLLRLRPQGEPAAALSVRLLPGLMERTPGNAALIYHRLPQFNPNRDPMVLAKMQEEVSTWIAMPLSELPQEAMDNLLNAWRTVRDELKLAARREACDWQLPWREQSVISLLIPEGEVARSHARLLAAEIHLNLAKGEFHEALEGLKTGYSLARHVAAGPTLVHGLVGLAITQMMNDRLRDLVQQPGAPNLYWALTALPSPFVDLTAGFELESNWLYFDTPALARLEEPGHTADYWQETLDGLMARIGQWRDSGMGPGMEGFRLLTTLRGYPLARQALLDRGRPVAEVDAMPVAQVVLLEGMRQFESLRDDILKWSNVPYYESQTGVLAAEDRLLKERGREILPLASLLLPGVQAVSRSSAMSERAIAMLRIVEALRLHAAAHAGELPNALADIRQVPVPLDPVTGTPFLYSRDGASATLEAPLPQGLDPRHFGARYEIEMLPE